MAQLERAAPVAADPMARGVELLGGLARDHLPGLANSPASSDGSHASQQSIGSVMESYLGHSEDVGTHLEEATHHEGARMAGPSSVANLSGLAPALRQVRRGPAAPIAQRRATSGVVWPKEPPMSSVSDHLASMIDTPPSAAPAVHAGTHPTPGDASSYASAVAPAPDSPAPPAKAAAAPPDPADAVRRALLLDRERSGSLADLW
jgi:hypothetical protein